jgi:multiple sugar transport system ATP-binding protein
MADVALRNVVKRFDDVDAVRNISLTIPDNEFVVLVGPSGCGKSTTLRMIAGLEEATAGDILIGGEVVNDVPPKDRDIAMVFQNYALYPHMTVFENMSFGLKLRRVAKAEIRARVEQAAKILDITDLLGRRPKQLSGGQRQRVAMGRAIVRNPKVFLFDEPLSNLDAKLRVQMRTEIKRVHQKVKTTTIYVTHDQVEAMTLADRVVVMNGGRIEQIGRPQDLYHRPKSRFVAGFIGSPAMNFLPARLQPNGDGLLLRLAPELAFPVPPTHTARYQPSVGKDLILGLRPEHITAARRGTRAALRICHDARRDRAHGDGDHGVLHGERNRGLRARGAVGGKRAGTADAALRQPQPHAPDRSGDRVGVVVSGAMLAADVIHLPSGDCGEDPGTPSVP